MLVAIVEENSIVEIKELDGDSDEYRFLSQNKQILIDIDSISPQPRVGWKFDGVKLIPSAPKNDVEYVMQNIYDPLVSEFSKIRRQFIAENILWGIELLGKTRAVANFMEPIEKWFNRYSPSESITEIEIAKATLLANEETANNLTPFVTVDRLNWYKLSILQAVEKTKG